MSVVQLDYLPRAPFAPLHYRTQRWAGLVCHRRAGKTVACVNEIVARSIHTPKKNARYAYIAPFYRQAKDVAWVYLKEAVQGIAVKVRESDLRVELPNGAWITLYGADNPNALRGLYLDGVVLDEYGDCRPSLWAEVILPTLTDRKGWAIFIGTPKGKNHFYKIMMRAKAEAKWYHMILKASDSGIIDQEELDEMRSQMTADQYAQELECSFEAAVVGTYYADMIKIMEDNFSISPDVGIYDPNLPVSVSSDIGYTDSTALWFWQVTEAGPEMIDYYENDGKKLQHYADLLESKPYDYDKIYLPHDAKAATFQTGRSTIEQFIDLGFPAKMVPKLAVQHGIEAARFMLPKIKINSVKCEQGVEALRAYRRSFNEITQAFGKVPFHDWSSNGADSFRYFSLVSKEALPENPKERNLQQELLKTPEYTLDELWKEKEDGSWRHRILRL